MKRILILLTIGFMLLPTISPGAQPAQARLFCLSLRFQRGTALDMIASRWTMELTSLNAGINGELAPLFFAGGYSNGAYLELYSELIDDTFPGALALDTPDMLDVNGNGFDDFFEVSQAVPSRPAEGSFNISGFGGGNFIASWYRDAGATIGSCTYTIPNPIGGGNLTFTHLFELLELTGTLSYTPGSNTVSGSMSLTNTNSMNALEGPATFTKSLTNRFNRLTLQSVLWTNASLQTFDLFIPTPFLRRSTHLTNYYGNVEFNDGDPNSFDADYYTWILSLDDLNDADHDGIPDFSDDLQSVAPPRRPQLSLTRGPTSLLLSISGDVGRLHHVLESTELATGNWLTNLSLTLTNDPQVVSLPLPPAGSKFWRVTAQ